MHSGFRLPAGPSPAPGGGRAGRRESCRHEDRNRFDWRLRDKTGASDVNKSQLIDKLAVLTNQTNKVAEGAVNIFFSNIKQALSAGDKVEIRGFGSFLLKSYNSYTGRNPKTGEKVLVPRKELPFFRAGKDLRERVNSEEGDGEE
jgi:integration host factor subunit beta